MSEPDLTSRIGVAFFAIALLLVMNGAFAAECWGDEQAGEGAVMWWSFDNADTVGGSLHDSCDAIGYNTTGTIVGATTGQPGRFGESYFFDSTADDAVWNGTTTDSEYNGNTPFSFNVWINYTDAEGATHHIFQEYLQGTPGWWYMAIDNAEKQQTYLRDTVPVALLITGNNPALNTGAWTMMTTTFDSTTDTARYYANGSFIGSANAATAANFFVANSRLSAGARWSAGGWTNSINGTIDEASIFNYTLGTEDIYNLRDNNSIQGSGTRCWNGSMGASHWWTLDEITGAVAYDLCDNDDLTIADATLGQPGMFYTAYQFDGVNDELTRADNNACPDTSGDFSIAGWIDVDNTGGFETVYGCANSATATPYLYVIVDSGNGYGNGAGVINVRHRFGNATAVHFAGSTAVHGAGWTHIAVRSNGSHWSLFVNGTQDGSVSKGQGATVFDCLKVGEYATAGSCASANLEFNGEMDELSLHNSSLSIAQITDLMNNNFVAPGAPAPPPICNFTWTPTYPLVNVTSTSLNGTISGNSSAVDSWHWEFVTDGGTATGEDTLHTFTNAGQNNVTLRCNISGVNYTGTNNITVNQRPVANWTITSTAPYFALTSIQFNDTSTDPDGDNITYWWWDFGDGNLTSNSTQNATNTFILPGEYNVSLVVQDNKTANSTAYTDSVTINGFSVDVFDATTLAAIPNWNMTITNSSGCSYNTTLQNNTWLWNNFSSVCTGSITIRVSANGYVQRTYYGVYNVGSYINLDVYLLDSASGVYPVFIVRDGADYTPLEDAVLTFRRLISGAYVTVSQATTDASGTTQVYLDPTVTYRLTVVRSGYTTYTTDTFTPVSTTYIISLDRANATSQTDPSNYLYLLLRPQGTPEIDNVTVIEFECNDPWSNTQYYNLTIQNAAGTVLYIGNGTGASCGIITYNVSALGLTPFQWLRINGTVRRNGRDYVVTKRYYLHGSAPAGTNIQYWLEQTVANNWLDRDARSIVAFIVTAGVVIGAGATLGWGAGLIGIPVAGAFTWVGWMEGIFFLLVAAATLMVYASRRWDR